jgi:mannose-6-phosphate isomerase-like protein (cupin superfamily)
VEPAIDDEESTVSIEKVNLADALGAIAEHWRPHIVGEVNGSKLQLAKFQGEFVWHRHDDSEDVFLVLKGRLEIDLPDKTIELEPGELVVIPRGVEHRPRAEEEVHVLNIELIGTVNTGDAEDAGVLTAPEQYL